jgi:uncharacterized membrane protein HdeD (DUF308 family)
MANRSRRGDFSMPHEVNVFVAQPSAALVANWGWVLALGVGLMLLGGLAIWRARAATMVYMTFLGTVLLVAALALFTFTFYLAGNWSGFFLHLLWAILLGVAGLVLVTRPATSAEAVTLFLSFYLIVTGLLGIAFAMGSHLQGEGLYVLEGVLSAVLGGMLLAGWPVTGVYAIGLFVGIALFIRGATLIAVALSLAALVR